MFIYGKKNKTRGNHAHKKSNQLFIHVSGTIILNIFSKKNKKKFVLNAKKLDIPIYSIQKNTMPQITQILSDMS